MKPKISVVVLNWNNYKDSMECLSSLIRQKYSNLEIIFVDNGSTDGSLQKIKKQFPNIKFIANTENLGYAEGNNVGIKQAIKNKAEYVFILNNDTVVKDTNLLNRLLESSGEKVAAISPIILNYHDRKTWSAGGKFHNCKGITTLYKKAINNNVNFIPGTALLIKARILKQIGLFDPNYFLYFEDTDLCTRIINAGYELKINKNTNILHKESATAGKYSSTYFYYFSRNYLYNISKNLTGIQSFCAKLFSGFYFLFLYTKALKYNQDPKSILFGIKDFFKGNMGKRK